MKTLVKKGFAALLALVMLTCCSKEVVESPFLNNGGTILVEAKVKDLSKAGYSSSVLPEQFVIDIIQGKGAEYDYVGVEMVKAEGDNSYSSQTELVWASPDHDGVEVKAVTLPAGVSEVEVATDQSAEADVIASDVLGATIGKGVEIDDNTIYIAFTHLMSKLEVSYEFGAGFIDSEITVNGLELQNIGVKGSINKDDMSLSSIEPESYGNVKMYHSAAEKNAEVIFYPCVPEENPRLVINAVIDGSECTLSCPVMPNGSVGFIGGKRYKMSVLIEKTAVSGTSATIASGWDTDTEEENFVTE